MDKKERSETSYVLEDSGMFLPFMGFVSVLEQPHYQRGPSLLPFPPAKNQIESASTQAQNIARRVEAQISFPKGLGTISMYLKVFCNRVLLTHSKS